MRQQDLLSSFAILMRAAQLAEIHATREADDEDVPSEQWPAGEQSRRLSRAFLSIQDPTVRQAIIDVVRAIAELPN